MLNERNIGRVTFVDSLSVNIRLDADLKSMYKSGYEEIYPIARINSYIIIPVGAERIVAIVTRVTTKEETDLSKSLGAIFLTEANRYLSATMIGTIDRDKYIQGIYNYPVLDNPVWYVTRKELSIIFDQKDDENNINFNDDFYLPIGSSPAFTDFDVKINPDKMFAKHVAILGNTGSGKSCTLTSILQSLFKFKYNGQKLKNAHFILFDTNGEYKDAFNIDKEHLINPLWINDDGLKIPYWFMNYDDMDYLFEPTTGTQGPILKRALGLAKSGTIETHNKLIPQIYIHSLNNFILSLESGGYKCKCAIKNDSEGIYSAFCTLKDKIDFDLNAICEELRKIVTECEDNLHLNNNGYITGDVNLSIISGVINKIRLEMDKYNSELSHAISSENRNIDMPLYYDFQNMMSTCFDIAIQENTTSQDRISEYVSTLKLRMQSFVDDIRLSGPLMLHSQIDASQADNLLIEFLSYILGDFCKVYSMSDNEEGNNENKTIYENYYDALNNNGDVKRNQITIIDMSLLPFQVLETITGLIGRIILDFLAHFDKNNRGSMPIVIALEEAQNYIPEINYKEGASISRKVFERIAREGRKYGLSLLVSSQRPSELSKTVLSQCNSFIVHRIQNPDDQTYIKRLVSSASSEILNQLPSLPQQHAILMGDCVRTPIVAKINTANPIPNSNNPKFIEKWLEEESPNYKSIINKWVDENNS